MGADVRDRDRGERDKRGVPDPSLLFPPRSDEHPLSPSSTSNTPYFTRRLSSVSLKATPSAASTASSDPPSRRHASTISSGSPAPAPAQAATPSALGLSTPSPTSTPRQRRAQSGAVATPLDADLLGIGPSRRRPALGRAASRSPATSAIFAEEETPRKPRERESPARESQAPETPGDWAQYLDSLDRDELALLDTRWEDMTDGEIAAFLEPYHPAGSSVTSAPPRAAGKKGNGDVEPLFPPSPPGGVVHDLEHPLRVLSRAVRELREAVTRLEDDNKRLRLDAAARRASDVSLVATPARSHVDQTLHDGLADALSTSLTSPIKRAGLALEEPPRSSVSPTPSVVSVTPSVSRAKSPAPSHTSARSVASIPERPRSSSASASGSYGHGGHKRNSGWGSIWGWGKKPGRKGSIASLSGSITPSVAVVEEDSDDEWRRGDGGSTPSFRAIFLATRILTPDPSSLLVDSARINTSSSIARLAHTLVSNARDGDVVPRDPPTAKRERARSRAASVTSQQAAAAVEPATASAMATSLGSASAIERRDPTGAGYSDQAIAATVAVGRTLLSRGKAAISGKVDEPMARPALVNRATSRPFPTTAMAPALQSPGEPGFPLHTDTPPPSVELGTIVPDEARPPTVLLSRQNLASFFQSSRVGAPKLATATRFTSDQPPLTDRYGFIYDIQHASMLKDASRAGTPAPISLTGHVPELTELPSSRSSTPAGRSTTPAPPANAARLPATRTNSTSTKASSTASLKPPAVRSDSTSSVSRESTPGSPISHTPETTPNGTPRKRTTALQRSLAPAPSKPTSAKDQTTVSVRGASSLQTGVSASALSHPATPLAEPSASRLTVSSLLDQLTDIHDKQQKARTTEWDAFLRKKTRARIRPSSTAGSERRGNGVQDVGVGAALAAVVNMGGGAGGKTGQEEYRAFLRLVRRGIPIPYRADVWAECSGARDLLVPGEYAEILAVHKDDKSPVIAEIEKDVGRTFPGNVFFGGDGPGVAKLRRVLTAYSWHNPAVGYCQGMNMLAATLLLTHTDEEQAFWVLHCIIERLLPQDYYTPTLLGSRADQRALADLVAQHVPRVAAHLDKLQVDLASVTFGWFLSLFTDCLPVETLFRVWDVFFVEGHDVLFRVAIAILKINETDLLACDSVGDLFTFISGMTSRLWGADKLIALQHSYKSVIRHADIQALYDKAVVGLQRELGED